MLIYRVPVYRRIALTEDQAKADCRSGDIMAEQSAPASLGTVPTTAGLEPDAVSVAQDTLIGLADTGPTVSVSFTLVLLIAATAYGGPGVLVLTAIPMLIIANAYRRLNLWNANCGASSEWVGRAINPYLGYMTGWLMLAGTLFGTRRLLPAPCHEQLAGHADHRTTPDRCRRLPRLHRSEVNPDRPGGAELFAARLRRGGIEPHLRRQVRLEIGVLQHQAGKLEAGGGLARWNE